MYAESQKAAASGGNAGGQQAGGAEAGEAKKDEGNVVDAEFTEVKDKKTGSN